MKALPLGSLIASVGKAGADTRRHLLAPIGGNQVDPPIDGLVKRMGAKFRELQGPPETPEEAEVRREAMAGYFRRKKRGLGLKGMSNLVIMSQEFEKARARAAFDSAAAGGKPNTAELLRDHSIRGK